MDGCNGVYHRNDHVEIHVDGVCRLRLPLRTVASPVEIFHTLKVARTQYDNTFNGSGPWTDPTARRDVDVFPYTRQIAELLEYGSWPVVAKALTATSAVPTVFPVTRSQLLQEFLCL